MEIGIGEGSARRTKLLPRGMRVLGRALLILVLILTALPALSLTPSVSAASLVVNSPNDPGDGTCDDTECTLREAIDAANVTTDADIITFDAAVTSISLTWDTLSIYAPLTIQGPGSASLTIEDATGCNDYSFYVGNSAQATMSGLTLVSAGCIGSGFYVSSGTATLADVVVRNYNESGISSCGGNLTITNSLIEDNLGPGIDTTCNSNTLVVRGTTVQGNGGDGNNSYSGGIEASGVVLIVDSTIANNAGEYVGGLGLQGAVATINSTTITGNTAGYAGGGIAASGGVLQVYNSTISGNSAGQFGGGIAHASGGTLQLANTTVSANTTGGIGGGIFISTGAISNGPFVTNSELTATLSFVTLAANSAGIDGGGFAALNLGGFGSPNLRADQVGDAALAAQEGISINLLGSIVAGNVDNETTGQTKNDCFGGPFTSGGYNLFGAGSDCPTGGTGDTAFSGAITSVLNTTLANNGGQTPTHALTPNSPANSKVPAELCASPNGANGRDQRGFARPQGANCDSGAYEANPQANCVSPFTDVANASIACPAIVALSERGVVRGYGGNRFGPTDPVQRAQMAAFIVRAFEWENRPTGPTTFNDFGNLVAELRTASLILANACEAPNGCVARGYGDGRFGPNDQVSYAQVISFVTRAFQFADSSNWQPQPNAALPYTGVPSVHANDIRTYTFYAGNIPDAPTSEAAWNAPAPREWVARVIYFALQTAP